MRPSGTFIFWASGVGRVVEAVECEAGEIFSGQLVELVQEVLLLRSDEGGDGSFAFLNGVETSEIVVGDFVKVELNDVANAVDIDGSCDGFEDDQNSEMAFFELTNRTVTEFWFGAAVEGTCRDFSLAQGCREFVESVFRANNDENRVQLRI